MSCKTICVDKLKPTQLIDSWKLFGVSMRFLKPKKPHSLISSGLLHSSSFSKSTLKCSVRNKNLSFDRWMRLFEATTSRGWGVWRAAIEKGEADRWQCLKGKGLRKIMFDLGPESSWDEIVHFRFFFCFLFFCNDTHHLIKMQSFPVHFFIYPAWNSLHNTRRRKNTTRNVTFHLSDMANYVGLYSRLVYKEYTKVTTHWFFQIKMHPNFWEWHRVFEAHREKEGLSRHGSGLSWDQRQQSSWVVESHG